MDFSLQIEADQPTTEHPGPRLKNFFHAKPGFIQASSCKIQGLFKDLHMLHQIKAPQSYTDLGLQKQC